MIPFFPAHEYLAALWDHGWETFTKACFAHDGHGSVDRFWKHVSHLDWAAQHPAMRNPELMAFTIPGTIFGDDGRLFKSEKMVVWQLSFFLSRQPTVRCKFIVGVMPYWMVIPNKTLKDCHRVLVWMFEHALEGKYALKDHLKQDITRQHGELRYHRRGRALCQGEARYRIAFVGFKADLQYEKITFKFNTYDQNECCKDCFVVKARPTRRKPLYTHTGPNAPWRGRRRTTQGYLARHNHDLEVLTGIPGWCLALHRGDLMHLMLLGFALHFLGSMLMALTARGRWRGRSLNQQLKNAWRLH